MTSGNFLSSPDLFLGSILLFLRQITDKDKSVVSNALRPLFKNYKRLAGISMTHQE